MRLTPRLKVVTVAIMLAWIAALTGCSQQALSGNPVDGANSGETGSSQRPSAQEPAKEEKLKVGFLYIGPVGDSGWTFQHEQARKYLEQQLPFVETSYVESVTPGQEERLMRDMGRKGYKLIFATALDYQDSSIKVAQEFPNMIIMQVSGWKLAPNVGQYYGRLEEGRYLTGIVAGSLTKSGIVGFVAAHPVPTVIRGINAFALGARSVNPNVKVKVVWTNTWYDPPTEKEAAKSLLSVGADVIAQHQDTPSAVQAAEEAGAYSIGSESDMRQFAPKGYATGTIWNWKEYYVKVAQAVHDGTWKSELHYGGLDDGIVQISPLGSMVSDQIKAKVEQAKTDIISGKLKIFAGPLKDNNGREKVPAGKVLQGDDLLSMNWFVEGIDGTIPNQ